MLKLINFITLTIGVMLFANGILNGLIDDTRQAIISIGLSGLIALIASIANAYDFARGNNHDY